MKGIENMKNNIRALRTTYGESQAELGKILGFDRKTISSYENGRTVPDPETVNRIAAHFGVTVDDLMKSELPDDGPVHLEHSNFARFYRLIPRADSKEALKNSKFRETLQMHNRAFSAENLPKSFLLLQKCIPAYRELLGEEECREEAAVNLLSIVTMIGLMENTACIYEENGAISGMLKKDREYQNLMGPDWLKHLQDGIKMFRYLHEDDFLMEMLDWLMILKKSGKYRDMAEYYLAMMYICNYLLEGNDRWMNYKTGCEMLFAFMLTENRYAEEFIEFYEDTVKTE